jgi:hypothetical protein
MASIGSRLAACTVGLLALASALSCSGGGKNVDQEATDSFWRHLDNMAGQRAKITYSPNEEFTAASEIVLYLSGTPGRYRLDIEVRELSGIVPPFSRFVVFGTQQGALLCFEELDESGDTKGSCFPDGGDPPIRELYLEELWPLLQPSDAAYPVLSRYSSTSLGRSTECYEVRLSDEHAIGPDVTQDFCFTSESLLVQADSSWTATAIGDVSDAEFELPYPLAPAE